MAGLAVHIISVVILSICWEVVYAGPVVNPLLRLTKNANSPEYHMVHFREIDIFDECTLVVNCGGRGIKDTFEESCENNNPGSLTTTHFTILGNPETSALSLYSDAPNTLVVLREGKCTLRTYKTTDDKTTYVSDPMDQTVCEAIKKKMITEMAKGHKNMDKSIRKLRNKMAKAFPAHFTETPISSEENDPHKNDVEHNSIYHPYTSPVAQLKEEDDILILHIYRDDSPTQFISYPSPRGDPVSKHYYTLSKAMNVNDNKECHSIELEVKGRGICDTFMMDCSMNDLGVWSNKKVMLFGHPKHTQFSFFVNEPQSLYLFTDNTCEHRQYVKTEGVTTPKRRAAEPGECDEIKKKIDSILKEENVEFDGIQVHKKEEEKVPVVMTNSDKKALSP